MKEVALTPRAVADLAEIRRYSRRIWGAAQARRYLEELGRRFEALAAGTATVRDAGFADGYLRCRHGSHLIIFTETAEQVRVVRVLHVRMDIAAKLGPSE